MRRVWTSLPPIGTPLDGDSDLCQGLVGLAVPWQLLPVDPVTGLFFTFDPGTYGNPYPILNIGKYGPGWYLGPNNTYSGFNSGGNENYTNRFELIVTVDNLSGSDQKFCTESVQGAGVGTAATSGVAYPYGVINTLSVTGTTPITDNLKHTIGVASNYSTGTVVWIDGYIDGSTTSTPFHNGGSDTFGIAGGTGGQHIYIAALYNTVLTQSQRLRFSDNPWQIFHRRRRAYSLITGSTISASISEAVTSADAYAISATATATITTAATSADAYALAATVPSAISEAISAASSDSYTTSATIFATLTETLSPSDAYALAVTISAALDSAAAASSALTAVVTIAATIAEVSTAQDTLGVTATILAAIAEAATATDTQATGSVTSAAYAESATAAAIFSATVSIAATLTEAGLAADQIAAMATVAADLAESGAASDAYLSSVLLAVELLENAAAADELSATAFAHIIDAAKTIITILQALDTVNIVQALDTLRILQ